MRRLYRLAVVSLTLLVGVGVGVQLAPRAPVTALQTVAQPSGTIRQASTQSGTLGERIDYEVYLPAGYARSSARYPTIYLLHGRGDTMQAWTREKADLDRLMATGAIPPMIAVMPDAPWSERASWYVDSKYTGADPGQPVETALTRDLVKAVDSRYRTVAGRWGRAVGGYSMGGAGALRWVLAHQGLFGSAIVLSPAVFTPLPPADDDLRNYGAFGVGDRLFVDARYTALNYPALLAKVDPRLPIHIFLAVGDKEYVEPDPANAHHDLDFEEAIAYNQLKRTPGVTADWRVLGGGHDWGTWQPAFVEGIQDLAGYLSTTKPRLIDTSLLGTSGDDWPGGVVAGADGTRTVALAASGSVGGQAAIGGLDAVVQRQGTAGAPEWTTEFGTAADDRLYGAVDTGGGTTTVAGYSNGDLDGSHPVNTSGDMIVARLDASGNRLWTTQFGDPTQADRIYAEAPDGAGGVYVAGYTKGSVGGVANAGDKDAVLAHVTASGAVDWTTQFGGTGEDKALAVAATSTGVYVAGVTSGAMPGGTALGGTDGWLAAFSPTGSRQWLRQVGSDADDLLHGVAVVNGLVVTAGSTSGTVTGTSLGGSDVLAAAYTPAGAPRWVSQFGTSDDDAAAAVLDVGGHVDLLGFTRGKLTAAVGGADVFLTRLDGAGAPAASTQFGTAADDGVDIFGESQLAGATRGADVAVTGVTYGGTTSTLSHGGADVFVTQVAGP